MALGVPGTGPYGKINELQQEINACRYELDRIAEGMRRRLGKKRLQEIIEECRANLRQIKKEEKTKKK